MVFGYNAFIMGNKDKLMTNTPQGLSVGLSVKEEIRRALMEYWGGVDNDIWDVRVSNDCSKNILDFFSEYIQSNKPEKLEIILQPNDQPDYMQHQQYGYNQAIDDMADKLLKGLR